MVNSEQGQSSRDLWSRWVALWNGDLDQAKSIISPTFRMHMTPLPGTDPSKEGGPGGLAEWIGSLHAVFDPLSFEEQVGPLIDGDMLAGRWVATGILVGPFPGAKAPIGTSIRFAGADFLRVKDGKIVEYWLSADVLDLLGQLQISQ